MQVNRFGWSPELGFSTYSNHVLQKPNFQSHCGPWIRDGDGGEERPIPPKRTGGFRTGEQSQNHTCAGADPPQTHHNTTEKLHVVAQMLHIHIPGSRMELILSYSLYICELCLLFTYSRSKT